MKKTQKITREQADRMYPFLCAKFQVYFNYKIKELGEDVKETDIEQDLIDYSYMVNKIPKSLLPFYMEILTPSPPIKNPILRFFKKIILHFKYARFFLKMIDPSLIRLGEEMIIYKHKKIKNFKKVIVVRTRDGVVVRDNPSVKFPNSDFKYIRGKKLSSQEYINCKFRNVKITSL